MGFLLTTKYVKDILTPCAEGNWSPLLNALDPEVHWMVVDPERNPLSQAGVYNVESWKRDLMTPFLEHLQGPVHMVVDELDVIGNKAIFEARGWQTQKNGRPYRNTYCWILIFSEETGKVVTIREYMNSAHTKEIMESAV
ncbi:hypothetical protein ONS95_005718 [Cadophora gregata]|uniref:uncharacterized protein n=1 Tax=Cadophora gregata TaxID=51156 RepID=UPI0026DAB7AA|nr:uncharacterized protein ONS95_005718 [Cadophora gregata]KAK0103711.1 hypothetical protein ONS95_005718 [Cadophora gregata]